MPKPDSPREELLELARWACDHATRSGASGARAAAYRSRSTSVDYRDRKLDTLEQSTEKGLTLTLFMDGKFSSNSTNDLRKEALERFVAESVAMTRYLGADADRLLPDPALYAGRPRVDLDLADATYGDVEPDERHARARAIEEAALAAGDDRIISVTARNYDISAESALVASNGLEGYLERTWFGSAAEATARDAGDQRPEDWWEVGYRHRAELDDPETVGRRAVERALRRVGAAKIPTEELPVIVENRAANRLIYYLSEALDGRNLQQRMSFFEGKQGEEVAAPGLTMVDDPLIPRGVGSRLYDSEGIAARAMPIIERGVLANYYIDTYYGRKLGLPPTTGDRSNVVFRWEGAPAKSPADWMRELGHGLFITSFIGGNSNSATGDFSTGVQGFLFEGGELGRPVAELNLAGNHLTFWKRLAGLGDDPYPYGRQRCPSLVFEPLLVAGA